MSSKFQQGTKPLASPVSVVLLSGDTARFASPSGVRTVRLLDVPRRRVADATAKPPIVVREEACIAAFKDSIAGLDAYELADRLDIGVASAYRQIGRLTKSKAVVAIRVPGSQKIIYQLAITAIPLSARKAAQ